MIKINGIKCKTQFAFAYWDSRAYVQVNASVACTVPFFLSCGKYWPSVRERHERTIKKSTSCLHSKICNERVHHLDGNAFLQIEPSKAE